MKDDYERRRKAERLLIRTLPDVEPSLVSTPIHQERLNPDSGFILNVCAQESEFIATSTDEWQVEVCAPGRQVDRELFDVDSFPELNNDALIPRGRVTSSGTQPRRTTSCTGNAVTSHS